MSDDNIQTAEARRRRVRRLKKYIIGMVFTGVTVPLVLSIFLLVRVQGLTRTLDELTVQMQNLTELVSRQQEQFDKLAADVSETGEGSPAVGEAVRSPDVQSVELMEEAAGEQQPSAEVTEEKKHKVYLTFDDGPSVYTDDILDILDRYEVKATFFVVGKENDTARELVRDIVDRGHTLGMHSYSHKYNEIYASVESFAEDFTRLRDYLWETAGVESRFYRFPGGSSNTVSSVDMKEYAEYLEEQNVVFFDWNIASGDAGGEVLSVETLVANSLRDIEEFETSVILLHDASGKRTTVEALPIIIENILAMEDTVILPITEDTKPVQHIQ